MRLFGLIGYPLGHSFSVSYFADKFLKENISGMEYRNFPIRDISELPALIKKHPNLAGLNVTIPYKEQVLPYLDKLADPADKINAVNTIAIHRQGGRTILTGHNTDAKGFRDSLPDSLIRSRPKALMLGTGGASKAIAFVLGELGFKYKYVSRKKSQSTINYQEADSLLTTYQLIINCTPLGMHPHTEQAPPINYNRLGKDHFLYDLTYNPEVTTFMAKGKAQGTGCQNGLDMLIRQAEAAWAIWNR
jgi:shikimate dehydrogenase